MNNNLWEIKNLKCHMDVLQNKMEDLIAELDSEINKLKEVE